MPESPPRKRTSKRASKKADPATLAPAKKRASKKKPAPKKKAAPKKKRAPRKKKGPVTAPNRDVPTPSIAGLKRWLGWELATWTTGAVLGLAITGGVLWKRANTDLATYLANPPHTVPGVIYSAPIEVRPGVGATVPGLAGDLLAAGYERVDVVKGKGQFSVKGGVFDVEGKRIVVKDQRIARGKLTLRPTVLATVGAWESRRTAVDLDAISPFVEPALLSMEDARFREHSGIDPFGVARAVANNLLGGGMQGGSTLTQQLAKNLFLSSERSMRRKVREAFFAAALEQRLSKDELLELYLGEVYLGQAGGVPIHGVEAAAKAWFGVTAKNLDLSQAATVAGVISAPNRYSPLRHPERARERRDLVLKRMVSTGAIDAATAKTVADSPLIVDAHLPSTRRAPWAIDAALDELEAALGEHDVASGMQVHTTIDPLLQRAAEKAVRDGMKELDADYPKAAGAQIALVAVRVDDGAVVAMVGGRSYADSPFNRATHAWRAAGSTVKPLTVLKAMHDDPYLTPITPISDEPLTRRFDGRTWTPANADQKHLGTVTLRQALEGSRNLPAVRVAEGVGLKRLQGFFHDAGLTKSTALPSSALGTFPVTPLEMASAYTVFPGNGQRAEPRLLGEVRDRSDDVVHAGKPDREALASPIAAALTTSLLQGVITDGTGRRAARYGVSGPVGGKTGTTDDYRDAWFVGFTPELAVAVWVGKDRGTLGLSGSRAALPTWSRFVTASGTMGGSLPVPKGLEQAPVCVHSGQIARNACDTTYDEVFAEGTVPVDKCEQHGGPVKLDGFWGGLFKRKGNR